MNALSTTLGQRHPRLSIAYDLLLLFVISINLLSIGIDALLMGNVGSFLAHTFQEDQWLIHYRNHLHQEIRSFDDWLTLILVIELGLRWLWAIVFRHYHRWFFFPFVHWYDVLGCIPTFRALRLLRVVAIGYRLHQMGYRILPESWIKQGQFYYQLVLEEISDRIVINVVDGIERELRQSTTHSQLIHQLINTHRDQITQATAELLQASLAPVLAERAPDIQHWIGEAVFRALEDIPELHRLMRLMPIVGQQIEQQVQLIGRRIGENLTAELIAPFASASSDSINPAYQHISTHVGQIQFDTPALEDLVESLVFESLAALKQQVAVKQWKTQLEAEAAERRD